MRDVKWLLPQVIVAALCAGLALFYFMVAFGFGDAGVQTPTDWQIAFDTIIALLVLMGFGLSFVQHRFPWLVLLLIPPMIRVLMTSPFQQDLYSLALTLGGYTDLLFLVGAGIGVGLSRWRQHRTTEQSRKGS